MAGYTFETMTQAQAAQFDNNDTLTFSSKTSAATQVIANQIETGDEDGLSGIELTFNGKTLTFSAEDLSAASLDDRILFSDDSRLLLGDGTDATATIPGEADSTDVVFAFEGDNTITGSDGSNDDPRDDNADWLNGGLGSDTITGSGNNDHIWGNSIDNDQPDGSRDSGDSLSGGLGGDYIQGNQGDDTIDGGADSDRILGGSGDDTIFGGAPDETSEDDGAFGSDTINGNIGSDTIDGGDGNDFLRGGRDNDSIMGGGQDDTISGDAGDDTIIGGTGQDIMSGDNLDGGVPDNNGGDTFSFGLTTAVNGDGDPILVSDALFREEGQDPELTDMIMDFQLGSDVLTIAIGVDGGTALTELTTGDEEGITFQNLYSAYVYAQGLLASDAEADIAAVQLNGDTMLFYASGDGVEGPDVDSAIRLVGIDVDDITAENLGLDGTAGGGGAGGGGGDTPPPSGF